MRSWQTQQSLVLLAASLLALWTTLVSAFAPTCAASQLRALLPITRRGVGLREREGVLDMTTKQAGEMPAMYTGRVRSLCCERDGARYV